MLKPILLMALLQGLYSVYLLRSKKETPKMIATRYAIVMGVVVAGMAVYTRGRL